MYSTHIKIKMLYILIKLCILKSGEIMKNIKRILIAVLVSYIVIAFLWTGKVYIIHQQHLDGLPVLGYHSVVSDEEKKQYHSRNPYVMSVSKFEEQMQYLYDNSYHTLTMEETYAYYMGYTELLTPSIVLTFDDGFENFNTVVKPILERFDFHATNFVIGHKLSKIDKPNTLLPYLKQEDIINDSYVSYYSHTYDLHRFSTLPYHKLIETASLDEIRQDFEKSIGIIDTTFFAYPYGISSDNMLIALQENNTKLAFSYNQMRHMSHKDNQYMLPRYQMFSAMPMWYFTWIIEQTL